MKIVVTGGRDFTNVALVDRLLDALDPDTLVVGDCPTGADLFARDWAERRPRTGKRVDLRVYEADWKAARARGNVRSAGPIRNARMVRDHRDAAFLLAFKGGTGTADCVSNARLEGVPVLFVGQYVATPPPKSLPPPRR